MEAEAGAQGLELGHCLLPEDRESRVFQGPWRSSGPLTVGSLLPCLPRWDPSSGLHGPWVLLQHGLTVEGRGWTTGPLWPLRGMERGRTYLWPAVGEAGTTKVQVDPWGPRAMRAIWSWKVTVRVLRAGQRMSVLPALHRPPQGLTAALLRFSSGSQRPLLSVRWSLQGLKQEAVAPGIWVQRRAASPQGSRSFQPARVAGRGPQCPAGRPAQTPTGRCGR